MKKFTFSRWRLSIIFILFILIADEQAFAQQDTIEKYYATHTSATWCANPDSLHDKGLYRESIESLKKYTAAYYGKFQTTQPSTRKQITRCTIFLSGQKKSMRNTVFPEYLLSGNQPAQEPFICCSTHPTSTNFIPLSRRPIETTTLPPCTTQW